MAIQRIVKMTFQLERCADFETYFDEIKNQVGGQPGCAGVKLLKDKKESGIYFTYSVWNNEDDLNAYRDTALFGSVWPKVKAWFADKPEAWSTTVFLESQNQ
jgi:heme-degrading monooxygenase HmoA